MYSDRADKAEILNNKYTYVFTSDADDKHANTVLQGPSIPSMPDIKFDVEGIELFELSRELAPVFTDLFQPSYDTGILPSVWKSANVTPVYKKGPVYEASNYRPVSLTCIPCKLMEHIICSNMRAHFDRYGA